ncbi:MAG: hypothetical protein RJA81_2265 [Planctomycetota bacterium]|jgi:predicted phosphoribosyltransferase
MRFFDRKSAGFELARHLEKLCLVRPVVLGIPRGGVVVAAEIARILNCDLDVILSRKLPVPWQPELALGAVSEEGRIFWNPEVAALVQLPEDQLNNIRNSVMQEIRRRKNLYRTVCSKMSVGDRTVILVDDGLATGATMISAILEIRSHQPQSVIVAIPVAASSSLEQVRNLADEVICLVDDPDFQAVGYYYQNFQQVEDQEVIKLLEINQNSQ